jgi:hypothetical protein
MLMHEALRLFGKTIKVDIGDPLSSESYAHIEGRQALTEFLYQSVQDTARIA